MFILTQLIERELMCLLLRWPYGQSTIGSQYNKTTYISQRIPITRLGLSGVGGGSWWINIYVIFIHQDKILHQLRHDGIHITFTTNIQ